MSHAVRVRPIIFSGPMARAILEGKKTQTRRIAKEFNELPNLEGILARFPNQRGCPHGEPGDQLWVRETWGLFNDLGFCDTTCAGLVSLPEDWHLAYRADHIDPRNGDGPHQPFWRPSVHMPRWASRITLEITGVRVERLQKISEEDAMAEGCPLTDPDPFVPGYGGSSASGWFSDFWEESHGTGSWDENPWVWVVEFRHATPEPCAIISG